jgi:hypothetical protein
MSTLGGINWPDTLGSGMVESLIGALGGPNGIWWLAGGYFSMVLGERAFAAIRGARYDDGVCRSDCPKYAAKLQSTRLV